MILDRRVAIAVLVFLSAVSTLHAQPPAETCGAGDSFDGSDFLPQGVSSTPSSNDFTMSGTGCSEQGVDHVTCFTPTNNCTVSAECVDSSRRQPELGLQFAVNAFQGACSTTPGSCLDSSTGAGGSGSISVALTAGTNYCFVCEIGVSSALQLNLTTGGDCGALPVELERLEIE